MTPKEKLEAFKDAFRNFVDNPEINGTADEFHQCKESYCGLWVGSEDGSSNTCKINGVDYKIYEPYAFELDPKEKFYSGGMLKIFDEFLDRHGFWAEPYDNATLMLYNSEETL